MKKVLTYELAHAIMKSQRGKPNKSNGFTKGSEAMEEMTNAELTVLLETLAKLVEATAKDAEDAARIIREAIPNK